MPLHVAFVWHMHQPCYVDPARQTALLPWVRLHATKGYLDMIWIVEQFPEFHCTFNLTPVLLQQIEQLAAGEIRDHWLDQSRIPAADLTGDQERWLLEHHFRANWANMVRPFHRYWSLLHKRGQKLDPRRLDQIANDFSTQDYRDLQVWFNLAWFGYAAQQEYPELAELKRKSRDFTEEDKAVVLDRQQDVLRTVIGRYKAAQDRGQIEISTTPFYHPILPLVYDTDFGRRCLPSFVPPRRFAHPEDVRAQLDLARQQYQRLFGSAPVGLWPSEGSVCPELIPILAEQGWQWLATDEDILWHSLPAGKQTARTELWKTYQAEFAGKHIAMAFRDRSISDFIGFAAARNTPRQAAEHVLGQIESVAKAADGADPLCAVVLDGENAWEHFADGGEGFLRGLYKGLGAGAGPHILPTTMTSYLGKIHPRKTIKHLHTGSWINANFHIWIGHEEDRRGWDLLGQTRAAVVGRFQRHEITTEQCRQAMEEIYAAEGSDWFWWYGDDFITEDDLMFDELFRTHLANAYRLAGLPPPHVLAVPICRSEIHRAFRGPTNLITPQIDGRITSYYEWIGAGHYQADQAGSTMYRGERLVEAIGYGCDTEKFYLRLDYKRRSCWPDGASLQIQLHQSTKKVMTVTRSEDGAVRACLRGESVADVLVESVAFGDIFEVAIPLGAIEWNPETEATFAVTICREGVELERHPSDGGFALMVPGEVTELGHWSA